MLLAQEPAISVVGEAADGLQAIRLAEALQPDILLLDIRMPGLGGIEALPQIREKSPGTKVLILSGFSEGELMIQALQLGAKGYLSKLLTHRDLIKAIRATYAGEVWAERKVLSEVLESLRQKMQEKNLPLSDMQETLTDREHEIVKWVIQGMTNKEIATRLGISDKTVKTHLSNIFNKLKISRRLQLVLHRIVEQPD
jgi:DNA-binding NarL/FixJ family response regulator